MFSPRFQDPEFCAQYDQAVIERREQQRLSSGPLAPNYDTTAQKSTSDHSLQYETHPEKSDPDSAIPRKKPKRRRGQKPPEHRSTHRPVGSCDVFARSLSRRARFARLRLLERVTDRLAGA